MAVHPGLALDRPEAVASLAHGLPVLKESEFKEGTRTCRAARCRSSRCWIRPRRCRRLTELWAWAHVHVNGGLGGDPNAHAAVAAKLGETVPSRTGISPTRALWAPDSRANVAYHAFPSAQLRARPTGGAGGRPGARGVRDPECLGRVRGPGRADPLSLLSPLVLPHRDLGDFEYLVRLLKPRTVDPRVGRRHMDVQRPEPTCRPSRSWAASCGWAALSGRRSSRSARPTWPSTSGSSSGANPYPHAFQTGLAALVNLANAYATQSALDANGASGLGQGVETDDDPLIVPPLYSRWHSQTPRLVPPEGDPELHHWVQELNLDPRHRVAAGFGTNVVQQYQENYMEAAWLQVGNVLNANQRIRYGQMAKAASLILARAHARRDAPTLRRAAARDLGTGAKPAHGEPRDDP